MTNLLAHMIRRMARASGLHTQSVTFFALALSSFVFAVGSEPAQLANLIPAIVWAVLLLSALLGLPTLLETDAQDGTIDDYLLSPRALPALMALKLLAHWAVTGLPASIAASLCVLAMAPAAFSPHLIIGLGLGSLCFSAIGLLGATLTLGSGRAATLQAVIVMPLCVPPLIFGSGAAMAPMLGVTPVMPLSMLAAIATASTTLAPFAAAAILRMKIVTP